MGRLRRGSKQNVKITVEAGSFNTDEYRYVDEEGTTASWWLSTKVPGALVSYKMEDSSGIAVSELLEIINVNRPKLYK